MISDDQVADHYARPDLVAAIEAALSRAGKPLAGITTEDLAPVDEFHAGGRAATKELLSQLELAPGATVLDVGCGLGGPARFCAREFGARVTGVDLSADYIEAAQVLTRWVDLEGLVDFRRTSATDLPFKKRSFDAAYVIHAGMNIADKTGLFSGLARVLRPGSRIGVYDIMRTSSANLAFPLPWAPHTSLSFVSTPASYESSLAAAGFEVTSARDQMALVRAAADEQRANLEDGELDAADRAGTLGTHLLMGDSAAAKLANLVAGFTAGIIVPYEIIAVRG